MSLLLHPCTVALETVDGQRKRMGIVLHSTDHGVLMWRLDAIKVGDEIYFTLRRQVSSWFFTCITDYSQWVGFNVEAVRRGEFTAKLESHKVPDPDARPILRKSGATVPLVNLAASHAFL